MHIITRRSYEIWVKACNAESINIKAFSTKYKIPIIKHITESIAIQNIGEVKIAKINAVHQIVSVFGNEERQGANIENEEWTERVNKQEHVAVVKSAEIKISNKRVVNNQVAAKF